MRAESTVRWEEVRPLPRNLDAERSILGAILVDDKTPNTALRVATEHITSGDFSVDSHCKIFRRILAMSNAGQPVDLVTLTEELQRSGELEASGGAGYLAKLIDGVPRLSNLAHYARIVRQKAALRRLAHGGQAITQAALEEGADLETILAHVRELPTSAATGPKPGLRAVTVGELLTIELKPREMLLEPILAKQSLAMIYSKRGVGKTFFSLAVAHAVSTGGKFLNWNAPRPRHVLFVDGELPATSLRDRLASIMGFSRERGHAAIGSELLQLVTPDLQAGPMPDLATPEGQVLIEDLLQGNDLVILDNLSALCRSGKENEAESWLPVQEWALRLRQQGLSILFIHHAGKGGEQRGTSRREDLLDVVISLRHPSDYSAVEGLRCEVHFEKCRALLGADAEPFEVRLQTDVTGALVWTTRTIEDAIATRVAELAEEGRSVRDIAEELGISKSRVHRIKTKLETNASLQ